MELFEHNVDRKYLRGHVAWFVLWLVISLIGAFVLKPSAYGHGTHTQLGLPPCGSVLLFDRPCPGCGLTTSWTAVLHGQFGDAFHDHMFGPILYLGFTFTAFACLFGFIKRKRFRQDTKLANVVLSSVLVVFLVYGTIRFIMTPLHSPFTAKSSITRHQ
ncbi:MAG: DUF2752 domain-containing protein [Armatimonadetes bacterium]|nr:DUF2752 domain-containing protein [Armatimonadota bacterium]